ncbi:hypothetical protein WJX75_006042 [Coccomyxa subellipsoidea]|uniref:Uncharacterized protein n=1 Tax=Coccomyxa subellipsoidea TaxID=248742 RepID=A0ABR2YRW6_9CHLO
MIQLIQVFNLDALGFKGSSCATPSMHKPATHSGYLQCLVAQRLQQVQINKAGTLRLRPQQPTLCQRQIAFIAGKSSHILLRHPHAGRPQCGRRPHVLARMRGCLSGVDFQACLVSVTGVPSQVHWSAQSLCTLESNMCDSSSH